MSQGVDTRLCLPKTAWPPTWVVLKVPPGTQPGRKFRVKGLGIEKAGRKGDQLVQVQVQVPEKLTPEQEELLKKFAEAGGMAY